MNQEGGIADEPNLRVEESSRLISTTTNLVNRRKTIPWLSLPNWIVSSHPIVTFVLVFVAVTLTLWLLTTLLLSRVGFWKRYGSFRNKSLPIECPIQGDPIHRLESHSTIQGMKNGVVASDHSVCSTVGKNIMMENGGNAVDAAVATALCLGVANPASSGIGGGMSMVLYADQDHHEKRWQSLSESKRPKFVDAREQSTFSNSNGKNNKMIEIIDAREVAPEMASVDMYLNPNIPPMASTRGGLAIAVLGELRGLELAHARHGSLDWATVVEPAFRLARDGVIVTKTLETDISDQQTAIKRFNLTDLQTLLARHPNQTDLLQEGDTLRNPALARTLEAIMKEGADAVYRGFRAKNLAKEIQDAGGIITERDLERYQATLRSPLISEASGFTFVSVPPPSSGGATIMGIVRFLSGFSSPLASLADTLSVHRLVEAMRHAFAIRMSLADPGVPSSNTTQDATHDLIDGAYMDHLIRTSYQDQQTQDLSSYGGRKWAQLKDGEGQVKVPTDAHEGDRNRKLHRDNRVLYREFGYLEDSGTTHVSIVDSMGNAVSLTSSINTYFGSGIVSKSTGIVLNNQMDDFGSPGKPNYFGLKPAEANFIAPFKKPLSSMSPMLIFKREEGSSNDNSLGTFFLAIGASGGPKIITSVVQVFIHYAMLGMTLFDAMAHPRIHDQILYHESDVTCYESCILDNDPTLVLELSNRTKAALRSRGHQLLGIDFSGVVQAVAMDLETGTLSAVSDIRKGGSPDGY